LKGDAAPYPTERSGRDLRKNRKQLLAAYRKLQASAAQSAQ